MNSLLRKCIWIPCLLTILTGAAFELGTFASGDETDTKKNPTRPAAKIADEDRVSLDVARDRARTMHDIYATTLESMHRHYFHGEREKVTVPARAMEDIFYSIKRNLKAEARWISVNSMAMSIDHEPETEFEKRAARAIMTGKETYDTVEEGFYRHAGAIPLHGGCLRCHGNIFGEPAKGPRYAGLVISIPIHLDASSSDSP